MELRGADEPLAPVRLIPNEVDVASERVKVHRDVHRPRPDHLIREKDAVSRLRVSRVVCHRVISDRCEAPPGYPETRRGFSLVSELLVLQGAHDRAY